MNQQEFQAGKAAYQQGDWARAVDHLEDAKASEEIDGTIDHLLGNALMKLGRYDEAAAAYADALSDTSYGKRGALGCNRGRALLSAGRNEEAVEALVAATQDPEYATPYKAFMALGSAQAALGDVRSAGVAFRSAAIDESNPDPSKALTKLGGCFMQLGRPIDAVEAFRTALDFSTPQENQAAIYAELGSAYVAANRMSEAVDAFAHAEEDGYVLSPTQAASNDAARKAVAALTGHRPSETDALLEAAGFGVNTSGSYDPLDPLGKSGEFIPSAEDTGFFNVTEEDLLDHQKSNQMMTRKHRGGCLRFFVFLLFLLALLAGAAGYAYFRGFGWPSQADTVQALFDARANGDIASELAPNVSEAARATIEDLLPLGASVTVDGIDQTMTQSKVLCTAKLNEGGEQQYEIVLVRNGIGWKVATVDLVYTSADQGVSFGSGTQTTTGTLEGSGAAEQAQTETSGSGETPAAPAETGENAE